RSAQSDTQSARQDLRFAGAERGLPAGARSSGALDRPGQADRARSEHAANLAVDDSAVAVLGQPTRVEEPKQCSQSDVRWERPSVDHVRGAFTRQSRILQGRL